MNHRANQNKLAYGIAFKQWVETHTPDQIKEANNARKSLRRKLKKSFSYHRIIDSRIPKQPRNAFTQHSMERHLSGDFKGIPVTEAAKLIGKEWQDLPAAGKQVRCPLALMIYQINKFAALQRPRRSRHATIPPRVQDCLPTRSPRTHEDRLVSIPCTTILELSLPVKGGLERCQMVGAMS